MIGNQNKPGEMEQKKYVYKLHLCPSFGKKPIDEIGVSEIAQFRARLLTQKPTRCKDEGRRLTRKSINNILAVLSKSLRYGVDVGLIPNVPKVGLFKTERPEIEFWDFGEYARVLQAARTEGDAWYAAACLAGEAGLRVGEVRALQWEHLDLIAGTLTVSEQMRHGVTGTPKGGRRRVVPMTATLLKALKALSVVRVGYVVRNLDGTAMSDGQTQHAIRRIVRRAGVGRREWHALRHSYGTHSALLGVNPWRLQAWMGHSRIDETMLYVHVAGAHMRPLPVELQAVPANLDPDHRVLWQLGQRHAVKSEDAAGDRRCTHVAPEQATEEKTEELSLVN